MCQWPPSRPNPAKHCLSAPGSKLLTCTHCGGPLYIRDVELCSYSYYGLYGPTAEVKNGSKTTENYNKEAAFIVTGCPAVGRGAAGAY